ncbi:NAD(P)H-dependent oxidoreductase [Sphingomonas sp. CL5.1]|uniref:NADPH-dependent FMN reductase n=1 Tax=Sphingomonas sp. CL5.1 TaxID=2653203 RepID=UPI00158320FD|nr:NAD(P)H-dependent oxidoreductase [Sphingomonas sp. CL5.1]QKS01410.1 NAD(P)H-dependent oxidoreductase [Sphingomonas sp. CL5.1]
MTDSGPRPFVVAIGGTLKPDSSTEKALVLALRGAEAEGAEVTLIAGVQLDMPLFNPSSPDRSDTAGAMVDTLRRADGVIIGSPGYHGSISGLVKNALDYTEDMRDDPMPYFHGRPVGSLATGAGWQGAVNTLTALRNIVHALRGWNTPMGVAINTAEPVFAADGTCLDTKIAAMLEQMGREIATAARARNILELAKADHDA